MRFLFIFLCFFLAACGQLFSPSFPDQSGSTSRGNLPSPGVTNTTIPAPTSTNQKVGVVKCKSFFHTSAFNQNLRSFLSSTVNPQEVGDHSCTKKSSGGVFFSGKMQTDKPIDKTVNQDIIMIPESSYVVFYFETNTANKPNVAPITFNYTYGSVDGTAAVLTFENLQGAVDLNGQLITRSDGKFLFTGTIQFKNYKSWNGNQGSSGNLGEFAIEACNFFQC
ncbi:MAG: hypothetical protein ACR2M7_05935 [Bdellovibrionales bacterium]